LKAPAAFRWRARKLNELDGRAFVARAPMRKQVKAQKVLVRTAGGATRGYAWGQFLDPEHHSPQQWGRFGTTAAIQVLAMELHWSGRDSSQHRIRDTYPVSLVNEDVIPTDRPHPDMPAELKPDDFTDPMKVAFLVDAAEPDRCDEWVHDQPALVDVLIELRVDGNGWSTRPDDDEERQEKDRLLITAYALYVLRRFPTAQTSPEIGGAWAWLAQEVRDRYLSMGEDLLALSCLALHHAPQAVTTDALQDALHKGLDELYEWTQRSPVLVTRAYFNCYSRGVHSDYIFLNPEILCALLFLSIKKAPRKALMFALEVVQAVIENILPGDELTDHHWAAHGFTIQRGMEGTVDQMWTMRLLRTFHLAADDHPRELRPSHISWPTLNVTVMIISAIALVLGATSTVIEHTAASIAFGVGCGTFSVSVGALLLDLRERMRYDRW
jgi:hypothetical protein